MAVSSEQACREVAEAAVEEVRAAVLRDVDARVAERTDELWKRGKQMMAQMQQKHKEHASRLQEEVRYCSENCAQLEAENASLRQALNALMARLAALTPMHGLGEAAGADQAFASSHTAAAAAAAAAATLGGTGLGAQPPAKAPPPCKGPATPPGIVQAALPGTPVADAIAAATAMAAAADASTASLPEFPFPSACLPPLGPMLSLAEALPYGQQTPHRTPLSLAGLVTPPGASQPASLAPTPNVTPGGPSIASAGQFSFTIRKADDADLGLSVTHSRGSQVLLVEGIKEGGAVEAWNRLCEGSKGDKVVVKGDRIISVNKVSLDPELMLQECQSRQLLKLTVVKEGWPLFPAAGPAAPGLAGVAPGLGPAAPVATATMRATASEFVPAQAS